MRSTRTSRPLFVIPNAAEREFFYGVNFEVSYAMPQFSDAQGNLEIRPIIGWRKGDYEFIINPIVDMGSDKTATRYSRRVPASRAISVKI